MTTQLKLKKSSVQGRVPQASDLDYGELAINYADGIIYYKNSSNQVKSFIDSDLILLSIIETVDSDYVQARQSTDSALIVSTVNDIVDSAFVQPLVGTINKLDEITTNDSATYQLLIDSVSYSPPNAASLLVSVNGIIQEAGDAFTINSDTITFASTLSADSDTVDFILALGRAYNISTIADGSVSPAKFSSAITVYDSSHVTSIVDSAYIQARQVDLQRDSAFITNIIDSDYINNRVTGVDSAAVTGIVDSAYVQARQITYSTADFADSAYVTTQINNLIDGAPGTLDTLNEIAAALNDDDSAYATLVGLIGQKVDSAAVIGIIDSDYINNRVTGVDSAAVTGIVDSAYVALRQEAPTAAQVRQYLVAGNNITYDSATGVISSTASGGGGADSATVIAIVDSDYVSARVQTTAIDEELFIASGTQTEYTLIKAPSNTETILVSLDGVVQPSTAYSLDSSVLTISPALDSNVNVKVLHLANIAEIPEGSITASKLDATLTNITEDTFVTISGQTEYTLTKEPTSTQSILVSIDGIIQPTSTYSLDSTVMTITPALDSGTDIKVLHLGVLGANPTGSYSGNLIPTLDSTYDLGDSTAKWRDLYLSTLHLGTLELQDRNGSFVIIDSDSNELSLGLDSSAITQLVDSDYINNRVTGVDSAAVTSIVDSDYVEQRSGAKNDVFWENSQLLTTSHTIVSGRSALSAGPITIDNSVTVTLDSGSRWVIL